MNKIIKFSLKQLQQQQELQLQQQMQQTQLQLQQHLQLHHHQHQRAAASIVDYSNSPASPMASPTGGSNSNFVDQQQPPMEGVGSEMLQQKAALEDFRGLLESAVNEARGGHSTLACLNDKLASAPRLKFLQDWQMHNFFGEQPKSPTETPPEMEETIMPPSLELAEARGELKNLATLCSAAELAEAVTAKAKVLEDIAVDIEIDEAEAGEGEGEGEENTLPPEPIELTDYIVEEEEVDDDDEDDDDEEEQDTQSGEIDKINYEDEDVDADAEVDYIDEDDAGNDDDEDDDAFFLDVNVAVGECHNVTKSGAALPPKQRKMSTRLENLILTKPDVLTQSLCDYRQDLPNSELMHMLPLKAAAANKAALNSLLQQQLAAATAAAVHAKAHNQQQQQETEQCGKSIMIYISLIQILNFNLVLIKMMQEQCRQLVNCMPD